VQGEPGEKFWGKEKKKQDNCTYGDVGKKGGKVGEVESDALALRWKERPWEKKKEKKRKGGKRDL